MIAPESAFHNTEFLIFLEFLQFTISGQANLIESKQKKRIFFGIFNGIYYYQIVYLLFY